MFSSDLSRVVALLALTIAPVPAALFDFESVPGGTNTPFSFTQGGITATFSSTPGTFFVGSGFFSTLTGGVLLDDDAPQLNALHITFSKELSSLSLLFALNSPSGLGSLTLTAFLGGVGGTLVGTTSASGTIPADFFYPEGSLVFNSGVFDAVTITSDQVDFAIDNLMVTPNETSVVPEPGTVGLLLTGLAGIVAWHRRRERRPNAG